MGVTIATSNRNNYEACFENILAMQTILEYMYIVHALHSQNKVIISDCFTISQLSTKSVRFDIRYRIITHSSPFSTAIHFNTTICRVQPTHQS